MSYTGFVRLAACSASLLHPLDGPYTHDEEDSVAAGVSRRATVYLFSPASRLANGKVTRVRAPPASRLVRDTRPPRRPMAA